MAGYGTDIDPLSVNSHAFEDTFALISELAHEQGLERTFFRQSRAQVVTLVQTLADCDSESQNLGIGIRGVHLSFIRWMYFPLTRPLPWIIVIVPEQERRMQGRQFANTTLLSRALHAKDPIDIARAVNSACYGDPSETPDLIQSPHDAVLEVAPFKFDLMANPRGRAQCRVDDVLFTTTDLSIQGAEPPHLTNRVIRTRRESLGETASDGESTKSKKRWRRCSTSGLELEKFQL
ncbi:hypothetical protein F4775DRAFT_596562 [Biscogniauxia sp. FL1348]|nr:hypothetical protein F4775DRAFT_596562 [Biscogniauxia sp. FL1348]